MYLSIGNERVDHRAAVVHREVAQELDLAGIGVYLHHRDVGTEGEDEVFGVVEVGGLEAGLEVGRVVVGQVGHQGNVEEGLGLVGYPFNHELAVLVHDVVRAGLEQVGGNFLGLVHNLAGGQHNRREAGGGRARTIRAPAVGHPPGVAVYQYHVFHRDLQLVGHHLAKAVSWPWPWLWVPVNTSTLPVGITRTKALSHCPACAPRLPTRAEGASPQASMKVITPMPM